MTEFSDLKKRIKEFKLDDSDKKAIDTFVYGGFMVLGLYVIVSGDVSNTDLKTIVGLLAIFIGVRFFPR